MPASGKQRLMRNFSQLPILPAEHASQNKAGLKLLFQLPVKWSVIGEYLVFPNLPEVFLEFFKGWQRGLGYVDGFHVVEP